MFRWKEDWIEVKSPEFESVPQKLCDDGQVAQHLWVLVFFTCGKSVTSALEVMNLGNTKVMSILPST